MLPRPNQMPIPSDSKDSDDDENHAPMLIMSSFLMALIFTLAGLSKFGNTSDAFFPSHKYMV